MEAALSDSEGPVNSQQLQPASEPRESGNKAFLSSIAHARQVLPLPKVTLVAHALGDLERRDQASFDLLAAFAGVIAR